MRRLKQGHKCGKRTDKPEITSRKPKSPSGASENHQSKEHSKDNPLFVVGICASAGGREAVTQLLGHLPANTGMAFVLVQRRAEGREDRLAALLSGATAMRVREATDGMTVEPDNVYVVPP
ncbi:MAG: chemotaxis protein CheR, partial [Nitrospirota bacterium]|nr:chemotaxis protein CheR [Nitrospirota bacterium]